MRQIYKPLLGLLTALLVHIPALAHSFSANNDDGKTIYYSIISADDKTVAVTCKGTISNPNYSDYSGAVAIPEEVSYNGTRYTVTSIRSYAFYHCSDLTSVSIPNSVTEIGDWAFYYCTGLTSVTIPNSVITIRARAFMDCSNLSSVTIGNSVTSIETLAFCYCDHISSINIPSSVISIGDRAFDKCWSLSSVHIDDLAAWCRISFSGEYSNPLRCGNKLYLNGSEITNLVIPNSVTSIGRYAFIFCDGLTSVTIPNSVTEIGNYAFSNCSGLTSLTIPNSVTTIGNYAFNYCSGLTSVTIPNSVTKIGEYAFNYCLNLPEVIIPESVTTIGSNAFSNCKNFKKVAKPSTLGYNFNSCPYVFNYNKSDCLIDDGLIFNTSKTELQYVSVLKEEVVIPNTVTKIGDDTFKNCTSLASVTIGNSVTSIGKNAFYDCSALASVSVPNSVTSIGNSAFCDCTGLASVSLGNSVRGIGQYAFGGCSSLTSINIPSSVTSIGDRAFVGCTSLPATDNVRYADSFLVEAVDKTLSTYNIKTGTRFIGAAAFSGCTRLTSINIPASVASISSSAFSGCTNLVKYTLPSVGTTSITVKRTYSGVSGIAKACVYWNYNYYEDEEKTFDVSPNKWFTVNYGFHVNGQFASVGYLERTTGDISVSLRAAAVTPTTVTLQFSRDERGATFKKAEIAQENGEAVEVSDASGEVTIIGLEPETKYTFNYTVTVEEGNYTKTATATVTTSALELSTLPARVVNPGEVVVCAESNLSDAERNVGFEWRKVDAPSTVPSKEGAAVLYGGVMEGHIKGLSTSDFYNFRPYYESATGKRQYGDWMGFDPSDFSYFEPTLHTYAAASVTHSSATMCGMAVPGSDVIAEQGFEYWPATAPSAAPAAGETSGHSTVKAEGLYMEATVEGLLPETAYTYRSYVKTDAGATVYGEEMEFTTLADPQAGIGIVTADGVEAEVTVEGYYDLNGRRHDEPHRGFNIVRYSDGSTRKLMVR